MIPASILSRHSQHSRSPYPAPKRSWWLAAGLLCLATPALAQIKAFPQAEGFGAIANGGRGGDVYHVTNLNNSGSGSLRYGLDNAPSGGRTIVFDVGGWIDIDSKLGVTRSNITIAGQTAPGGIGVRGNQFSIGGDDVVVRHVRFRPGEHSGSEGSIDAISANSDAERIIYDHVSAEFSTDGGFDSQATNLTLQYSSVSWGLLNHSTGSLFESAHSLTLHHNLYAHNNTRNPKHRVLDTLDFVNNVVYNWNSRAFEMQGTTSEGYFWTSNVDGNYFIAGPNQDNTKPLSGGTLDDYGTWFGTNAYDSDEDGVHDGTVYTAQANNSAPSAISSALTTWSATPYAVADEVWKDASPDAAYQRVLSQFGATPWDRDQVDQLLHDDVVNRTGAQIDQEDQLVSRGVGDNGFATLGGGNAPTDTDHDGIPDDWEIKHGTNPLISNNNGDFDYDGYTDLEEYLNDLAAFPAVGSLQFSGIGRYADWKRWSHDWEPSRVDSVSIADAAAFVDAVGQKAGTLRMSQDRTGNGRLYITSGWLEVTDLVDIGSATSKIEQYGGELRVLNESVDIGSGTYRLLGGLLSTPNLAKDAGGVFDFTGGALDADTIDFDLEVDGGRLAAGLDALGTTTINGDLTISSGGLDIDIASSSSADQYFVSGDVTLGGDLEVAQLSTFRLSAGAMFEILSANSIQGEFQSISPGFTTHVVGSSLFLEYTGAATVIAVPEPQAAVLLILTAGLAVVCRRHRRWVLAGVIALLAMTAAQAEAAIVAAGELVVDLRAADLESNSATWTNHDTSGQTLGNFSTIGGGGLNLGAIGGVTGLNVANTTANGLASELNTSFLGGNAIVSIEAWVYANSNNPPEGSNGLVAWGATDPRDGTALRAFRYDEHNSNGFYSGWYGNDFGWTTDPVTGDWTHVAYVYNGSTLKGYINGVLDTTATLSPAPNPATTKLQIGLGRVDGADPFDGYIADVRVHTGVLSDTDVLNNFNTGLYVAPSRVAGDYNNDGVVNLVDYTTWRNNLGGPSLANEEVSPTTVDIADYLFWRERFGATDSGQPAAVLTGQNVPEASTQVIALLAGVLMAGVGRGAFGIV